MTYWTIMIVTILGGYLDGQQFVIPYPSQAECDASTVVISTTLPYDHSMECRASNQPSGSIRPLPRPEGETP